MKVPVAVVPSLSHGSVYSYPPTQLIGLRCVFMVMSPPSMEIPGSSGIELLEIYIYNM